MSLSKRTGKDCLINQSSVNVGLLVAMIILLPIAGMLGGYVWGNDVGYNDGVLNTTPRIATVLFTVNPNSYVNWKMNDSYTNSSWLVNNSISFMLLPKSEVNKILFNRFSAIESWYRNSTGNSTIENYVDLSGGESPNLVQAYMYGLTWNRTTGMLNSMNISFYNEQAEDMYIFQNGFTFNNISMTEEIPQIYNPNNQGDYYESQVSFNLMGSDVPNNPMDELPIIISQSGSGTNITTADWIQTNIIDFYINALLPITIPLSTTLHNTCNIGNLTFNQFNDPDNIDYNGYYQNPTPQSLETTINGVHYLIWNNLTHSIL